MTDTMYDARIGAQRNRREQRSYEAAYAGQISEADAGRRRWLEAADARQAEIYQGLIDRGYDPGGPLLETPDPDFYMTRKELADRMREDAEQEASDLENGEMWAAQQADAGSPPDWLTAGQRARYFAERDKQQDTP